MQTKLIRYALGLMGAIFLCLGLSTIASAQAAQDRITQPINTQQVIKLHDRLSVLDKATDLGHLAPNTRFDRMVLVLKPSAAQQQDLDNLVQMQQEKGSSSYHQWLTPQQYGERFGASQNDINKITSWLQGQGFHVEPTPNSRRWIIFSGTSGQVEQTFHTQIHNYSLDGEQHIANATATSIPKALSPVVAGILSLHNFFSRPNITPIKKGGPSTDLGGGNFALSPADFATIYDINPLYKASINGAGQTIAIVGRSDIDPVDIADFRAMTGLPAPNFQTIVNGPDPGVNGDEVEQDLDVSWSGAVAPGAMIDLVVSGSTATTDGVDLSAAYIVDNDLAPVMSTSYGICEQFDVLDGVTYEGTIWEQAAAEGISSFVSAGDTGGAGCDSSSEPAAQLGFAVSGLASTPFNVAVGGTEFNDFANPAQYWAATNNKTNISSALGYIPETAWNESGTTANNDIGAPNILAGSGGVSIMYPKPAWQTGTGVPADGMRDLPDVSLTAAVHDGYIICLRAQGGDCSQGYFFLVGGTSASSPSFAGIMALINQQTNSIQGNPNPTLYALANSKNYGTIFHDTTVGDNKVPAVDGSLIGYSTTPSFDLATGWGSVDVNQLATAWMQVGTGKSGVSLTSSATTITHGTQVTLSSTVTPTATGGATPTGDISFLASSSGVNTSLGFGTLASGATQLQTNILPGGTQSVVAHYAGDPNYASMSSSPVSITVTPENSVVTLMASGGNYGLPVPLSASVVGATSGLSTATGTITFKDGSTVLNTTAMPLIGGSVNGGALPPSGSTSFTVPYLSVGNHALTASYSGDVSYNAATSTASTIAITQALGLLTLESSNMSPLANTPVTLTAQVVLGNGGSPSAPITGTVTFYAGAGAGATPLGTAPVAATSTSSTTGFYVAQLPVTFKTAGAQLITASYSGDANVSGAVPASLTLNVTNQSATRTSLTASAASVLSGASVTLTATVTGDTTPPPTPTGTVTFYDNGTSIGTGTVASGVATLTTTKLPDGAQNITASYGGDSNFSASQSSVTQVQVNDFTFTAGSTTATLVQGQSTQVVLTIAANANASINTPITLTCSGMPTGGTCSLTPSTVTPGTGSAESVLSLSTTGPTLSPALHHSARLEQPTLSSSMVIRLGGALLLGLPLFGFGFRRKGRAMQKLLGLVGLFVLIGMMGCGGSGPQKYTISNAGTPTGAATVTVTATAITPTGTLVHTTTVALTVQSAVPAK
ncbi:MAG: Ig-like domain repeat protein [Acidobacteriaceae bacterium]